MCENELLTESHLPMGFPINYVPMRSLCSSMGGPLKAAASKLQWPGVTICDLITPPNDVKLRASSSCNYGKYYGYKTAPVIITLADDY